MAELQAVPVIDLAPARAGDGARRAIAAAIDEACREIGFFAIRGHGIPDTTVETLRAKAHDFFARPLAEKAAARHPVAGTNRGYHAVGGETLAAANDTESPPDLKEFFHVGPVDVRDDPYYTSALGRRHFLPNLWPAAPAGDTRPPVPVNADSDEYGALPPARAVRPLRLQASRFFSLTPIRFEGEQDH